MTKTRKEIIDETAAAYTLESEEGQRVVDKLHSRYDEVETC